MFHALEAPRGQQLPMSPSGISDLGAACQIDVLSNQAHDVADAAGQVFREPGTFPET